LAATEAFTDAPASAFSPLRADETRRVDRDAPSVDLACSTRLFWPASARRRTDSRVSGDDCNLRAIAVRRGARRNL